MQRVRNNIHKARKHTQKLSRDIRNLRKQWRRDFYEKELAPETLRAMQETQQMIEAWLKFQEEHGYDQDD